MEMADDNLVDSLSVFGTEEDAESDSYLDPSRRLPQ